MSSSFGNWLLSHNPLGQFTKYVCLVHKQKEINGSQVCQGTANAVSIYVCHSEGVQIRSWQRQLITDLSHNLNETLCKFLPWGVWRKLNNQHQVVFTIVMGVLTYKMGGLTVYELKPTVLSSSSTVVQASKPLPHLPRSYSPFNVQFQA